MAGDLKRIAGACLTSCRDSDRSLLRAEVFADARLRLPVRKFSVENSRHRRISLDAGLDQVLAQVLAQVPAQVPAKSMPAGRECLSRLSV